MLTHGLLHLSTWGYIAAALLLTHITIAAVTIFLHRHQAHRSLTLHPVISHFFRFWLWLTTGMVTKEWVAVHRKHHAKCETEDDPHSPQTRGILAVLFGGAFLYRRESCRAETLANYGHGTPDDWIERHLYTPFNFFGVGILLLIDLLLFGVAGIAIYLVQLVWIPFWAAGVINGIGHFRGYRNFETSDASRNILPLGLLIGGEELHNNHHAYPQSARLSNKWWEFDIGWFYIRLLETLRLAEVKRTTPRVRIDDSKQNVDMDTVRALLSNRFHILKLYSRQVVRPAIRTARSDASAALRRQLQHVYKWMSREDIELDAPARHTLSELLQQHEPLHTVYQFKARLKALWSTHTEQQGMRLQRLQNWCREAEQSGIQALQEFAATLRGYTLLEQQQQRR